MPSPKDTRRIVSAGDQKTRAQMDRAARPKLAASLLLVRGERGAEEILMGLRSKKHDFMPDIYVFPGGRVDRADSHVQAGDRLNARTSAILTAAMPPARARASVMAAIRETYEETGFILGEERKNPVHYGGEHPSWQGFYRSGLSPDLSQIHVIGRAVTPPYRPKRFDTWFFMRRLTASEAERPIADSDELLDTKWVKISDISALKMHVITITMIDVLQDYLAAQSQGAQIPYSRFERGAFTMAPFPPV
ncbi:MAG: NUDIX hydrolase [Robiginitomaculum sp.]